MTQRVDLYVDGKLRNTNQLSTNLKLRSRILSVIGSASEVVIRRHVAAPVPPPAPQPVTLASLAANMVFCAQGSEQALNAPKGWPVALTADPAYATWARPGIVAQLRAQGRRIYAWGVQTQIPASTITGLRDALGLDGAIFQAETSEEYATAMGARAQIVIGNPNAWTDLQRHDATDMIGRGTLAVIGECYTNLGGPWPTSYSAGGVPICSICIGVYDGTSEVPGQGWYPTVSAYKQNCPQELWKTVGVYHAAGLRPEDWQALA